MSKFSALAGNERYGAAFDESRIKGWRRNRRSAPSLLPAVRTVSRWSVQASYWRKNRGNGVCTAASADGYAPFGGILQRIGGYYERNERTVDLPPGSGNQKEN